MVNKHGQSAPQRARETQPTAVLTPRGFPSQTPFYTLCSSQFPRLVVLFLYQLQELWWPSVSISSSPSSLSALRRTRRAVPRMTLVWEGAQNLSVHYCRHIFQDVVDTVDLQERLTPSSAPTYHRFSNPWRPSSAHGGESRAGSSSSKSDLARNFLAYAEVRLVLVLIAHRKAHRPRAAGTTRSATSSQRRLEHLRNSLSQFACVLGPTSSSHRLRHGFFTGGPRRSVASGRLSLWWSVFEPRV